MLALAVHLPVPAPGPGLGLPRISLPLTTLPASYRAYSDFNLLFVFAFLSSLYLVIWRSPFFFSCKQNIFAFPSSPLRSPSLFLLQGYAYLRFAFHPRTASARWAFKFMHFSKNKIFYRIELLVAVFFMALAVLEPPAVVSIPRYAILLLEFVCIAFFLADLWLRSIVSGPVDPAARVTATASQLLHLLASVQAAGGFSRWFTHYGHVLRCVVLAAVIVDALVFVAVPRHQKPFRVVSPLFSSVCARPWPRLPRSCLISISALLDLLLALCLFVVPACWQLRPFFLLDAFAAAGTRRVLQQIFKTAVLVVDMIGLLLIYVLIW